MLDLVDIDLAFCPRHEKHGIKVFLRSAYLFGVLTAENQKHPSQCSWPVSRLIFCVYMPTMLM